MQAVSGIPRTISLGCRNFAHVAEAVQVVYRGYYYILEKLVRLLIQFLFQIDPKAGRKISTHIYQYMKRDICAIVVELALLLQDPESYKTFLAYRGPGAQGLLDVLQDVSTSGLLHHFASQYRQVLDLDAFAIVKPLICKALLRLCRASGLYPRCFVLTELEKIGDQVAAGGFGDIWKGVIRKRSVCVKVMRLFKDSDIQALLKVWPSILSLLMISSNHASRNSAEKP
jgi:hypothetical protein